MTGSCLLYVTVIRLLELLKLLLNHSSRAFLAHRMCGRPKTCPLTHSVRPLPRKEAAFNDIIFFWERNPSRPSTHAFCRATEDDGGYIGGRSLL